VRPDPESGGSPSLPHSGSTVPVGAGRATAASLTGVSPLLRQGVVRLVLALNARYPIHSNRVLTIPSFFASWLTTEAAPVWLGWWGVRTVLGLRARRGRLGVADAVGVGLTGAAAAVLVREIVDGARAGEQLRGALSGEVPAAFLDERPRCDRRGALLPVLNGRGRRRKVRGLVYREVDGHRLRLDVYEPLDPPASGERRPAIIQIHGGAWVVGSKDEQGVPLLNHLASLGWVGFNIEYRLSPNAKFPSHLVDCKAALAWVREHAEEFGVDPDFIAVTGGSAGGHLCALMALTANDPEFQPGFADADTSVQAAVPFYGVYDLLDRGQDQLDTFLRFMEQVVMGSHPEQDPEGWASYSPIDRIHGDAPPVMLLHGDADVLVPVGGARRFAAALSRSSSNPVVYAELQGAQHAFEIFPSVRTVQTVEYVERFLTWVHERALEERGGVTAAGRGPSPGGVDRPTMADDGGRSRDGVVGAPGRP